MGPGHSSKAGATGAARPLRLCTPIAAPLRCESSCLSPGGLTCSLPRPPASRKSLTYFSRDPSATLQEATFDLPEVRRIFFGSFHKVLEGPGRTHACASLPKTLLAARFWGRTPWGSAGHRLPTPVTVAPPLLLWSPPPWTSLP